MRVFFKDKNKDKTVKLNTNTGFYIVKLINAEDEPIGEEFIIYLNGHHKSGKIVTGMKEPISLSIFSYLEINHHGVYPRTYDSIEEDDAKAFKDFITFLRCKYLFIKEIQEENISIEVRYES